MKSEYRKRLPEDMLEVLERSKKLDFLKVGEYNFGNSSRRININ